MVKESLIDVEPEHLKLIKKILKRHIVYKTVWAYGSRVNWTASQFSDLNLVVFEVNTVKLGELKEEFAESDLPFSIDIMSWEKIPEKCKNKIREKYVVLQNKSELEGWKECRLGAVILSNVQSINKDYPYNTIQYLDTGSITCGKINSFQELLLEDAPGSAKRLVKHNDIVYSTVRQIQRHYGFITNPPPNVVVSTGFSVIEIKTNLAESLFIYYYLTSTEIVEILDAIADRELEAIFCKRSDKNNVPTSQ
ncbi:nucleotidyltransferase [Candidatus Scalindua japonica]|uniref:Nucleotidyltransferase n=1 Tax=Candidatus Scalindua japonica TaxID=1284222 RepID=A0A286TTC7_9BACT|nr:nucleotidyltransferase domain-containing protein [Candidatus Scalindua japonica]GAX59121.1 nucleotidyltransferase [Candidatus Scalindua japonica]